MYFFPMVRELAHSGGMSTPYRMQLLDGTVLIPSISTQLLSQKMHTLTLHWQGSKLIYLNHTVYWGFTALLLTICMKQKM